MSTMRMDELSLDNIGSWPTYIYGAALGLALVIVLALGYFLHIKNQLVDLQVVQKQERQLKSTFEQKQRLAASLELYRAQLNKMQQMFGAMLRQLPSKTEIPGLIEDISKEGLASGLQFRLFDPLTEIQHEFYAELPINITVVGTYHQLATFVSRVATLSRIVTLHDFIIEPLKPSSHSRSSDNNSAHKQHTDKLAMSITANIYRYKED